MKSSHWKLKKGESWLVVAESSVQLHPAGRWKADRIGNELEYLAEDIQPKVLKVQHGIFLLHVVKSKRRGRN